eukprot:gene19-4270_t
MSESVQEKNLETKENLLSLFASDTSSFKDELYMSAPQEKTNFLKNSILSKIRDRKKNNIEEVVVEEVSETEIKPEEILEPQEAEEDISQEEEEEEEKISFDDELQEDFVKLPEVISTWKNVPWLKNSVSEISKHPNIQLHEEIIQFCNFLQPTELEIEHRKDVVNRLTKLLKRVHEPAELQIFGSYATGFVLPGSDIDFNVVSDDLTESERIQFLAHLYDVLRKDKNTLQGSVDFIKSAKVPIVKFVDGITGQHCDISFNSGGGAAIEIINKYSARYPAMKYLITIIKYFMKQRGLNEVYTGGISSYSLNLMLISHLQMHTSNYEESVVNSTSLATLLVDFFALYGIYFNHQRVAVEVTSGGIYREKNIYEKKSFDSRFVFIDPSDPDNNVSGGTRNVAAVKEAFRSAFSLLTSNAKTESPSILSRIITITKG